MKFSLLIKNQQLHLYKSAAEPQPRCLQAVSEGDGRTGANRTGVAAEITKNKFYIRIGTV